MFSCKAKRPADGVEESGAISFFAWSPILFGGRQREAQQVGCASEQAAAHSDAKGGALQYSDTARLAGSESAFDLRGEPRNCTVGSYAGLYLYRQLGAEHVRSEA